MMATRQRFGAPSMRLISKWMRPMPFRHAALARTIPCAGILYACALALPPAGAAFAEPLFDPEAPWARDAASFREHLERRDYGIEEGVRDGQFPLPVDLRATADAGGGADDGDPAEILIWRCEGEPARVAGVLERYAPDAADAPPRAWRAFLAAASVMQRGAEPAAFASPDAIPANGFMVVIEGTTLHLARADAEGTALTVASWDGRDGLSFAFQRLAEGCPSLL